MLPFEVKVLGGTFSVQDIVLPSGHTESEVTEKIQSVTPDRWFVLLDDEISEDERDSLALIDEEFEFQILAAGRFQGEEE